MVGSFKNVIIVYGREGECVVIMNCINESDTMRVDNGNDDEVKTINDRNGYEWLYSNLFKQLHCMWNILFIAVIACVKLTKMFVD